MAKRYTPYFEYNFDEFDFDNFLDGGEYRIPQVVLDENLVVYIDPPYKGTTGYKDTIDLSLVIDRAKCVGAKVFVSEYYNLSDNFTILSETTKGGISGDRKGSMVEYLSIL